MSRYYIDFADAYFNLYHSFEMTITKLIHFLKLGGILILEKKCSDGIQNQGETGVDCGGLCEPCSKINMIIKNRNLSKYRILLKTNYIKSIQNNFIFTSLL